MALRETGCGLRLRLPYHSQMIYVANTNRIYGKYQTYMWQIPNLNDTLVNIECLFRRK